MTGINDNIDDKTPKRRERRFGIRSRTFKKTQVILHEQDSVFNAILKNLSRTGAKLELPEVLHIPKEFRMRLVSEEIDRDCKVVWRKPGEMGIVFTA